MINDLIFLKTFARKDIYYKYHSCIKNKHFSPIEAAVLDAYGAYFENNPDSSVITDFDMFYSLFSTITDQKFNDADKTLAKKLIDRVATADASKSESSVLEYCASRKISDQVRDLALRNEVTPEALAQLLDTHKDDLRKTKLLAASWESDAVFPKSKDTDRKLQFNIPELNVATRGGLVSGNLVLAFGWSNAGKSNFALSVASTFAKQMKGDEKVLWFNTEEPNDIMQKRLIQVTLNISIDELESRPDYYLKLYGEVMGGDPERIMVFNAFGFTPRQLESLIGAYNTRFVVIDIADYIKVGGKSENVEALRTRALYQEFRRMAGNSAPMLITCQANSNAVYKKDVELPNGVNIKVEQTRKHLDRSCMSWSSFDKVGTVDLAIGIGYDNNNDNGDRFLSLVKNKLGRNFKMENMHIDYVKMDPGSGLYQGGLVFEDK